MRILINGKNIITLVRDIVLKMHETIPGKVWTRKSMTEFLRTMPGGEDALKGEGGSVSAAFTDLTKHFGILEEVSKGQYRVRENYNTAHQSAPLKFQGTKRSKKAGVALSDIQAQLDEMKICIEKIEYILKG